MTESNVTINPEGMVTVIPLGIVTLSEDPGTEPPHVAESFQFPFCVAVNVAACAS